MNYGNFIRFLSVIYILNKEYFIILLIILFWQTKMFYNLKTH